MLLYRNGLFVGTEKISCLKFHSLEHSNVETRRRFQKKFNVTKRSKRDIIEALFETFTLTIKVPETSGPHVQYSKRRMLKSFNKWSNSDPGFDMFQLRLDYDACPRTVSCATACNFFETGIRPANTFVLLLLMHARRYAAATECWQNRCDKHLIIR